MREANDSLKPPAEKDAPNLIDAGERRRLAALVLERRAMALAVLGERELADGRADELGTMLRNAGEPRADERARALKGWIAARAGDEKAALAGLEKATAPSMRLAYALALAKSDAARARPVMEELARRASNDAETALAHPRAAAWLRANPAGASPSTTAAR